MSGEPYTLTAEESQEIANVLAPMLRGHYVVALDKAGWGNDFAKDAARMAAYLTPVVAEMIAAHLGSSCAPLGRCVLSIPAREDRDFVMPDHGYVADEMGGAL